jgi:hypothetical protein
MEHELNEFGMRVWKHKTNKRLFLQQSYRRKDNLVLIDETEGRQIIDSYKASTYNYDAWAPITKEEYDLVKSNYKEIYYRYNNPVKPKNFKEKLKITLFDFFGFLDWLYKKYFKL